MIISTRSSWTGNRLGDMCCSMIPRRTGRFISDCRRPGSSTVMISCKIEVLPLVVDYCLPPLLPAAASVVAAATDPVSVAGSFSTPPLPPPAIRLSFVADQLPSRSRRWPVTKIGYFGTYIRYLPTNPTSRHCDNIPANPS